MRLQTKRNRLFISSWYIGAGSNISVFTRRPNQAFERIRQIYGEELERINSGIHGEEVTIKTLSEAQKGEIRNRAKQVIKRENGIMFASVIIAIVLVSAIAIGAVYFIRIKLNH